MSFVKVLLNAFLLVSWFCSYSGLCVEVNSLESVEDVPLNDDALWLPKKYQSYYIKLANAAQIALDQPRCIEVRQATLDLHQSTAERPMFRVLCREASGTTYTEMIDGVNYASLTAIKNSSVECHDLLIEKTQLMLELVWVNPVSKSKLEAGLQNNSSSSEPFKQSNLEQYQWDFDAKAVDGASLAFRAICTVLPSGKLNMEIKARR